MYIPVTDNDKPFYSEGFVVRFHKTDGTEWVANFEPGWTDFKAIIELAGTTNLLVIASGTCYLMDTDQPKPLAVFGVGYSTTFKTATGKIILQDQTDFTIVEPNGQFWHTERISWDGFEEVELKDNILTGLSYDPTNQINEWKEFSYNIDTKELIGGSYPKQPKTRQSRWKFW